MPMPLKIFLTSDLHLGIKFADCPEKARGRLVEERFLCLRRIVEEAGRRRADILLVAGDLFDSTRTAKRDIRRAAEILADFQGPLTAVLPGNHDFLAPDDELWKTFREAGSGRVLLLSEPRPYPLSGFDLDACLYAGPCFSKHSSEDAVGWVLEAAKEPAVAHHIGVAHGSIEGISPDFNADYYPMTRPELEAAGLDLWLIGHTHAPFPAIKAFETPQNASETLFSAGTPEPDGFGCDHGGSAWLLELMEGGLRAEAVPTGRFRFRHETVELTSLADLSALAARHAGEAASRELLKVRLSGRIGKEDREALAEARRSLEGRLLHLADWNETGVRERIDAEAIDREYPAGSFPHDLLTCLMEDAEALDLAHELLEEAGT